MAQTNEPMSRPATKLDFVVSGARRELRDMFAQYYPNLDVRAVWASAAEDVWRSSAIVMCADGHAREYRETWGGSLVALPWQQRWETLRRFAAGVNTEVERDGANDAAE